MKEATKNKAVKPEAKKVKSLGKMDCPACANRKGSLCRTGAKVGRAYTNQNPLGCKRYEKVSG